MGNATSRSAKTKSTPNGETIGGGKARGKTVEKMSGEEIFAKVELLDSELFPSDESNLVEESDVSSESDDEEEDEEEGKCGGVVCGGDWWQHESIF